MNLKFGKNKPAKLLSTISLANHLEAASTWTVPPAQGWEYAPIKIPLDMLGNDTVGDCVIAAAMHYAQVETANTENPLTSLAKLAIQTYSAITGYDPSQTDSDGNNPTDNGTDFESGLFPYWKSIGMPMIDKNGKLVYHKIIGFAALDLTNIAQQRYANFTFGGVLMGINCPQNAVDAVQNGSNNWLYDPNSPSVGGHGINMMGQGKDGWHIDTWGTLVEGTWEFSQHQADEMYVVVTPAWIKANGKSPSGLNMASLLAAQAAL
jgi:hypothetical protein